MQLIRIKAMLQESICINNYVSEYFAYLCVLWIFRMIARFPLLLYLGISTCLLTIRKENRVELQGMKKRSDGNEILEKEEKDVQGEKAMSKSRREL